ncbi:hypothetical protein BDF14DRAFT_1862148 [Spinellus fusiger]|nr:hypothetical protein BDF14DRAFT_1862148 [Spinellus fusiger]
MIGWWLWLVIGGDCRKRDGKTDAIHRLYGHHAIPVWKTVTRVWLVSSNGIESKSHPLFFFSFSEGLSY